jgi:predicted ribosome quality control (RQC) complex YloA/Tae2 family protein
MPYDGRSVRAAVNELSERLVGTKVHKIYQPVKDEIVLYFSDREKSALLLCANPAFPRVHLVDQKYDNPEYPPPFCMLLRKYLIGAYVKEVEQKEFDRIIMIRFEAFSEAGDPMALTLIAEIMGRHSNVILLEDETQKILHALKPVGSQKNSVRELLPGKPYIFPPNEKLNPLTAESFEAAERMSFFREKSLSNTLTATFSGLSNQLSASLLLDMGYDPGSSANLLKDDALISLCKTVLLFFADVDSKQPSYLYSDSSGKYVDFSYGFYSVHCAYTNKTFATFQEACAEYYAKKSIANHILQRYDPIVKTLHRLIAKEVHKLDVRNQERMQAEDHEQYNTMGNLLLAHLHEIKKGMPEITDTDYFSDDQQNITIPLRGDYSPSQNAQFYFKKYGKGKRALEHLEQLIAESEDTLYYLNAQLYYLTSAQNAAEAEEIVTSLRQHGFLGHQARQRKPQTLSKPYRFRTSEGFDVYVGKNDRQNDQLTLRDSAKTDLWFHTKNIPGSHVILKTNQGHYSETALRDAALLAAYHSKAKESENVPVDYAFVKYVKKPKGSP